MDLSNGSYQKETVKDYCFYGPEDRMCMENNIMMSFTICVPTTSQLQTVFTSFVKLKMSLISTSSFGFFKSSLSSRSV